jgi:hypothetical protein
MEKKTNTVIIVVVLALAVVAIGWYGVTGGAIKTVMSCNVCSDRYDGGANKNVAGITVCDNLYKADYCDGTKIYEYYCVGNTMKIKTMQCSQGCVIETINSNQFGEVTAQECRVR